MNFYKRTVGCGLEQRAWYAYSITISTGLRLLGNGPNVVRFQRTPQLLSAYPPNSVTTSGFQGSYYVQDPEFRNTPPELRNSERTQVN